MKLSARVPPSPEVMSSLYAQYLAEVQQQGLTFAQFLEQSGCTNKAVHAHGMDDGHSFRINRRAPGIELISIPQHQLAGSLRIIVLMVDFPDLAGALPASHYENLLFSKGTHPTGSMRDYFAEASHDHVDVTGTVHGWLRMPQTYEFYTNGFSGTGPDNASVYPRDARRLAEDAVNEALNQGIVFLPELDMFDDDVISALFVVHAGVGAEVQRDPAARRNNIWSHKWNMVNPVEITPDLWATKYLVVPNDCDIGVCAHELGHLAFQWEDFYDPNGSDDGKAWDGSGDWDLMAGGSYNGNSRSPAHPAALHKMQHGWIQVEEVRDSKSLRLPVFSATAGAAAKIVSPHYQPGQYLLLENRAFFGFDSHLPGEGLLVWRVDESRDMFTPERPALQLVQADGRHHLEAIEPSGMWNSGDAGDPFPGSSGRTNLLEVGSISTSFPNGPSADIELHNISRDASTGDITLDVVFGSAAPPVDPEIPEPANILQGQAEPDELIPDNDPVGIVSSIDLAGVGRVRDLAVQVIINHTYIGDLTVDLESPSGQRARLHDEEGTSQRNIQKIYRTSDTPELAALINSDISGSWRLHVVDHTGRDEGRLTAWALAVAPKVTAGGGSVIHQNSNTQSIPDNDPNGIASVIRVNEQGLLRAVQLELDISHTFIRDLRVELTAPSGHRALLHNRQGGSTANIQSTYSSGESSSFASLIGEPVHGDWVLRIADLEGADSGSLNRWRLELDLGATAVSLRREGANAVAIPRADPVGVGNIISFEQSGTVQSIGVQLDIEHVNATGVSAELIAPTGERALIALTDGTRRRGASLSRRSATCQQLAGLEGVPLNGQWILRIADADNWGEGRLLNWSLDVTYVT